MNINNPEVLSLVNSFLLSLISFISLIISFLLKDFYRDYKDQIERVNRLHRELNVHSKLFEELMHINNQQIERLHERIDRLEQQRSWS